MIDEKIAKVKALIEERERIDRELSALLGLTEAPKRGRPRKEDREPRRSDATGSPTAQTETRFPSATPLASDS